MSKYSYEDKLKVVQGVIEGKLSHKAAGSMILVRKTCGARRETRARACGKGADASYYARRSCGDPGTEARREAEEYGAECERERRT
jgi:hypothetical protein